MRVSLQHPQFFVATDGTDLSDIEPALEETGDRFVAKVMKVKI